MVAEQKSCTSYDCTLDANDNVSYVCSIKFQIVSVKIVSVIENIKTIKKKNVRNYNELTIKYDNEYFCRSFALAQ